MYLIIFAFRYLLNLNRNNHDLTHYFPHHLFPSMYRQRILEQQAEIEKNKPKGVPIFKVFKVLHTALIFDKMYTKPYIFKYLILILHTLYISISTDLRPTKGWWYMDTLWRPSR